MGGGPRGLIGRTVKDAQNLEWEITHLNPVAPAVSLTRSTNVKEEIATAVTLRYDGLLTKVLQVQVPLAVLELEHVQIALDAE